MKTWMMALALVIGAWTSTLNAVVVCYNNACGKITCANGCEQRAINGRCAVNRCTGSHVDESGNVVEENTPFMSVIAADSGETVSSARVQTSVRILRLLHALSVGIC